MKKEKFEEMKLKDAVGYLSIGHSIYKVELVKRICKVVKVPFPKLLVHKFYSDNEFKGIRMREGCEGTEGIDSLAFSAYVADQLGVFDQAESYFGRGSQARAYGKVIAKKLNIQS